MFTLFFITFNHTTFTWIIKERHWSIHWNCSCNSVVRAMYSCCWILVYIWSLITANLWFWPTLLSVQTGRVAYYLLNTLFILGMIMHLHLSPSNSFCIQITGQTSFSLHNYCYKIIIKKTNAILFWLLLLTVFRCTQTVKSFHLQKQHNRMANQSRSHSQPVLSAHALLSQMLSL